PHTRVRRTDCLADLCLQWDCLSNSCKHSFAGGLPRISVAPVLKVAAVEMDYREQGTLGLPTRIALARNHNTWPAARHGKHWYKFQHGFVRLVELHGTRAT